MSSDLERASLLRERGRHEEAVAFLLTHLAHHPEDPWAFIELSLNRSEIPGQLKQALEDARTATGLMPAESFPLSLQSRILNDLDKHKEALSLAESAIALDPEFEHGWNSKCLALIGLSRWKDAEQCARTALNLDPDDETASNLLAHTLRLQNRLDESEDESNRRLAQNPDNAFSFASAGWAALQRGDVAGAEAKFKEALRIEPDMEYAREGLKHSYRARSAFFRLFLKWMFFIQSFSEKNRTLLIISLVVGFNIIKGVASAIHPLLVVPVVVVYYTFLFGSFLSNGLANFFMLRDPVARLSLDRSEKTEGIAVGILVFGGLLGLIAGFMIPVLPLAAIGGTMLATALPASMLFTNPSAKGKLVFGLISFAALATGAVMAYDIFTHPGREMLGGLAGTCMTVIIVLCAGSTWLSMAPSLREEKSK